MPARDVTIGDTFVRISGQGLPLVFVHGFTTTSEFWREQAEEFSKAYRVIRINLPGHGASPAPTSRSYCIEDFVEDVARVFRELSIEKAVLIGLSMGGIVAQKFALDYRRLVEALVLVDTTAHGIGPDATADAFQRRQTGTQEGSPGLVGHLIQFLGLAGASRMGATRSHSNPGIRRPGSGSLAQ
jgi:pimeloyl-ACP methyl ester carboxylesterase